MERFTYYVNQLAAVLKKGTDAVVEWLDELVKGMKKQIDEIAGEPELLGSKALTTEEIDVWRKLIEKNNARLKYVEYNKYMMARFDAQNIAAAFDGESIPPVVWIRKEVSDFILFHEFKHLEEFNIIKKDAYLKGALNHGGTLIDDLIRTYKREKYVFDEILKEQKATGRFSNYEIKFSRNYFSEKILDCLGEGIDISKL